MTPSIPFLVVQQQVPKQNTTKCANNTHTHTRWRRKFAKSGGAILLERKYFYGKKLKSYGTPLK